MAVFWLEKPGNGIDGSKLTSLAAVEDPVPFYHPSLAASGYNAELVVRTPSIGESFLTAAKPSAHMLAAPLRAGRITPQMAPFALAFVPAAVVFVFCVERLAAARSLAGVSDAVAPTAAPSLVALVPAAIVGTAVLGHETICGLNPVRLLASPVTA